MFFDECTETVSLLHAIFFDVGDACIDLSLPSLAGFFGAFLVVVVILQWIARRLWSRLRQVPDLPEEPEQTLEAVTRPKGRSPAEPYESPIKPSRF